MKFLSPKNSANLRGTGQFEGQGTGNDPFTGDLATILKRQPPGETVILERGLYSLRPAMPQIDSDVECLSPGLKIIGAGRGQTVVRMDEHPKESSVMWFSGHDNVEFHKVTVDVAGTGWEDWPRLGIVLQGHNTLVKDCDVIRISGNAKTGGESWAVFLGNPKNDLKNSGKIISLQQRGNRVINCRFYDFQGDYCNAVSCGAVGPVVSGNEVYMRRIDIENGHYQKGHFVGFNLCQSQGLVCEDNLVVGGGIGFYGDTGNLEGAEFRRNKVLGAWHGFSYIMSEPMRDCVFEENLFYLNGSTDGGVAFAIDSARAFNVAPVENLIFRRNIVRREPGRGQPLVFPFAFDHQENFRTIRFEDNELDVLSKFKGCQAVSSKGNRCVGGAELSVTEFGAS